MKPFFPQSLVFADTRYPFSLLAPRRSALRFPSLTLVLGSCWHEYTAKHLEKPREQQMPSAQSPTSIPLGMARMAPTALGT